MKLSIISFTGTGISLSEKLAKELDDVEVTLFTKCSLTMKEDRETRIEERETHIALVDQSIREWAKKQMDDRNGLLFIGACGIAVRAVAPYLTDKLNDSPVLVMDEKGAYVIPMLSGHMGGANELALQIAQTIGAVPVITTATDLNKKFAVDLFAKKNKLTIVNKEGIAKISSKVLAGEELTISIEPGHLKKESGLPDGVHLVPYPPVQQVDIVVTSEDGELNAIILLKPKEYAIGMGCKRGKEANDIEDFIQHSINELGISSIQLIALSSIEQKRNEQGFLIWSRKANIPFLTFTAEELQEVIGSFHESDFVKDTVGVGNVCERAALKVCEPDGKLVYEKHEENGMTIAIAKRNWSVIFDEE